MTYINISLYLCIKLIEIKMKKTKKNNAYPLRFNGEKEIQLFKDYKRAAADLECSIRDLIVEAMEFYQKEWKNKK